MLQWLLDDSESASEDGMENDDDDGSVHESPCLVAGDAEDTLPPRPVEATLRSSFPPS